MISVGSSRRLTKKAVVAAKRLRSARKQMTDLNTKQIFLFVVFAANRLSLSYRLTNNPKAVNAAKTHAYREFNGDMMRNVIVYKWTVSKDKLRHEKVEDGSAVFHEWGLNTVETEHAIASYSVAIIEREDGAVETVAAELIKFIRKVRV